MFIKIKVIDSIMGSGKAQPIYSKVMTGDGYKKIGQMKVGDTLYGEDGRLHKILGVFPQGIKDVYEITFSDSSKARSCGEHLWTYQLPQDKYKGKFRTNTLYKIMELDLYKKTKRGDKNWQVFVPLTKPLEIPNIDVEVDPYTLGLLLGDGGFSNSAISFSNSEKDIINKLQFSLGEGFEISSTNIMNNEYNIIDKNLENNGKCGFRNKLKHDLDKMGLWRLKSNEKFIPQQYMYNSIENRIKILQGLIDTDGEVYANNVVFSTTSYKLVDNVQFLVQSLGGTCKIENRQTYYTYKGEKKAGLHSYRLHIKMPNDIQIFSSKKHKSKYKKGNTNPCRSIRSIKYVGKEECVCIYVSNPTHLYLTDNMIVTHNTHWAIEKIKSEPRNKFVYITPYLDEIKRVRDATNDYNKMYEPMYKGSTKHENLHKLLKQGRSICSTHALFQKSNEITREALRANNYILILDEVMDVVEELEDFTKDDLETLTIKDDLAYIEDDFLLWNKDKMDYNGRYNDIKNMALNKNLICINGRLLYWNFPVDIFECFQEVYLLTYMFNCQIQRYYYDFHNVEYEKFQVERGKIVEYDTDRESNRIREVAKLINVYEGGINSIGEDKYALSLNWFKKDDGTLQGILASNVSNWFNNINRGVPAKKRLWTTFKDHRGRIKGKGYTNRFISLNIRATNEYRETQVLAYCTNRFIKPTLVQFFSKRDIYLDQDQYALSEMLQWIWRSRIRENKSINIYIPSKRMRELLINYLQPKSQNKL